MVLAAAGGYALLPPLARIAYDHGADARGLLALRFAIAAPLLMALAKARPAGTITLDNLPALAVPSITFFFSNWAFFESLTRMSAVVAVIVFFSYPILVAIGGMIFLGEPLTRTCGALILLGSAGVYLSVGLSGRASVSGMALATASALLFSSFFLRAKHLISHRRVDGIGLTAWVSAFAGIAYPVLFLVGGGSLPDDRAGYAAVLGIALLGTVLAAALLYSGLHYLEAGRAAMLTAVELPLAVLLTASLLAEPVTPLQVAGMAVVLVAVMGLSYDATRARPGIPARP